MLSRTGFHRDRVSCVPLFMSREILVLDPRSVEALEFDRGNVAEGLVQARRTPSTSARARRFASSPGSARTPAGSRADRRLTDSTRSTAGAGLSATRATRPPPQSPGRKQQRQPAPLSPAGRPAGRRDGGPGGGATGPQA